VVDELGVIGYTYSEANMMRNFPTQHLTNRTTAFDAFVSHGWPRKETVEGGFLFGCMEGKNEC